MKDLIKQLQDLSKIVCAVCISCWLIIAVLKNAEVINQCVSYGRSYCQRWETAIQFKE